VGLAAPTRARRALGSAAAGLVACLYRRGVSAVEKGGELTGPNPADRGKAGSKAHLLCDANGLPLHVLLRRRTPRTARCSSRCRRPTPLFADVAAGQVDRDVGPTSRMLTIEVQSKLGRVRWVVERTISWLLRFKRLGLRYDRTERTTLPLLTLACVVINTRTLIKSKL
jgi:transposase